MLINGDKEEKSETNYGPTDTHTHNIHAVLFIIVSAANYFKLVDCEGILFHFSINFFY